MSEPTTQPDDEVPDDEQRAFDETLIDKHCDQLIEHFDSVVIFATRYFPKDGMASLLKRGRGNYYTQSGMVRSWIKRQDAEIHYEAKPDDE